MAVTERVKITAELVEAFAWMFLTPSFDDVKPTPDFHRECWGLYTGENKRVAVAAPRGHAKSSALTHSYGLAVALFREQDYIVLVSATEALAMGHLGDIARELRENEPLIAHFGIAGFDIDNTTDIVVRFRDGHRCRFIAKGSGQKMRGIKWDGKRPGLIICDDLEEEEEVYNRDRRERFAQWFRRALLPCMRQGGVVRMHGTILHEQALLSHLMRNNKWESRLYRAHRSFDDFSEILWPEQFSEGTLKDIRDEFVASGDAEGYSQEYLNNPLDNNKAFLRRQDFIAMSEEDKARDKMHVVGCDFAVSKADKANRTSFTIAGRCADNLIHFIDQRKGRWSSLEWVDEMFGIQERYDPVAFFVEDGVIWKSIAPTIYKEMQVRNIWMNLVPILPTRDKATRGVPFQKRMRAGACRFDKDSDWYDAYEAELLRFTGYSDAGEDDQFDSSALLVKGVENMAELDIEDFLDDEEREFRRQDPRKTAGRSATTGY